MASNTQVVETRRLLKKVAQGRRRKNHAKKFGSTAPNLPLNKPNKNELAQKKKQK